MCHGKSCVNLASNIVMQDIEERIFSTKQFDIRYWKRFVDDIWALLPASEINAVLEYINSLEPAIKFTHENEVDRMISFLDISKDSFLLWFLCYQRFPQTYSNQPLFRFTF